MEVIIATMAYLFITVHFFLILHNQESYVDIGEDHCECAVYIQLTHELVEQSEASQIIM